MTVAYITFRYADHEYAATVQSDSPDSIISYIERETRPFGLGSMMFAHDNDETLPRKMLLEGEVRRRIYDAIEASGAYDERLDA